MNLDSILKIAAVIVAFTAGYYTSDSSWERKAAQYKLELEKEKADALQKVHEKEQETNTKVIFSQGVANAKEDESNRNFESVVNRLRTDTTRSDDSVPADNSARHTETQTCECRVREQSRRAFRKLREDISVLMHDCEITSIKYNELYERALAQQSVK